MRRHPLPFALSALFSWTCAALACFALVQALAQNAPSNPFDRARIAAINASSLTNLKQIATAVSMYQQDYDEKLPLMRSQQSVWPLLKPYLKEMALSEHPFTHEKYLFNLSLSGKSIAEIDSPSSMALVFEPQPAPDETRGLGFVDGHARRLSEAEWQKIRAKSGVTPAMSPARTAWKLPEDNKSPEQTRKLIHDSAVQLTAQKAARQTEEGRLGQLANALQQYLKGTQEYPVMRGVEAFHQSLAMATDPLEYLNPLSGLPYLPNPALSGRKASSVSAPQNIVAFYDAAPAADGTRGVVFADGHPERVDAARWTALRKQPSFPAQDVPIPPAPPLPPHSMLLTSTLLPVFEQARSKARETSSMSNLKQLAVGILMYAQDFDEHYPAMNSAARTKTQLMPYIKNESIFQDAIFHLPFQYNARLAGKTEASVDRPAEEIIAFEARPTDAVPATRCIAFADSHCKRVTEGVFRWMCAQQKVVIPSVPADSAAPPPLPPGHPLFALLELEGRADRLLAAGDIANAIPLLEQLQMRVETAAGKESPDMLAVTLKLAGAYTAMTDFRRAFTQYQHAFALEQILKGDDPAQDFNIFTQLAAAGLGAGEPDAVQQLLERFLADTAARKSKAAANDREELEFKETAPKFILAWIYITQGKYPEADKMLTEAETHGLVAAAETMQQEATSTDDWSLFGATGELLQSYHMARTSLDQATGRQERARERSRQDLELSKLILGDQLIQLLRHGSAQENTATVAQFQALFTTIDSCIQHPEDTEAVETMLKQLDRFQQEMRQPNAAGALVRQQLLGGLMVESARYGEAEALFRQQLATLTQRGSQDLPIASEAQVYLARALAGQGKRAEAETLFAEALQHLRAQHYTQNTTYASGMVSLAEVQAQDRHPAEALATLQQILTQQQEQLQRYFGFSSEGAMSDFLNTVTPAQNALLQLALNNPDNAAISRAALDWTLRRKGIVLDTLTRFREAQRIKESDPEIGAKLARLRQLRQQLADREIAAPAPADRAHWEKERSDLRTQAETVESDLNGLLTKAQLSGAPAEKEVSTQAVQQQLTPGSALVEFVRVSAPLPVKGKPNAAAERYIAFVVRAEPGSAPLLVDLGTTAEVDALVAAYRKHPAVSGQRARPANAPAPQTEARAFRADGVRLCKQIFAPLLPALKEAKSLLLAPDGELSRIPFESLIDADDKYLIETWRFAYLTGGRDLLRPAAPKGMGAVVFAGPDYNLDAAGRRGQLAQRQPAPAPRMALQSPKPNAARAGDRGGVWVDLPGALGEAQDVETALMGSPYLPLQSYTGPAALEETFKAIRSPRLLHVATHGFYLPPAPAGADRSLNISLLGGEAGDGGLARLRLTDNPLLRSGLVLAGANKWAENAPGKPALDDGWVTAEEVRAMDLRGTEIVVLSACESGLGDTRAGEGVYGLRSAFLYAGARSLVTSLFSVPDAETRTLMQRLYANLKAGRSRQDALREAELSILNERRMAKQSDDPYYWSSFILVGER